MMTTLNKWTLYDGIKGENEKRLARILLVIILVFMGGSGVLIFLDIAWGDRTLWAMLSAGCFSQLIPLYLLHRGKLEISSYVTVGIYIFFATVSATIGQGIRDYVLIVYPSIILFSGLTQKGRGMIVSTVLTLLALAWLTFGDIYGLYTPHNPNPAIVFDFIILSILTVISSVGVHLLVENLEYNHEKTKSELLERKKAEALLHESEESFKEIFENSPDNIFVFEVCPDNRFRVKKINSALEKIFNTERANIEGKYLDEIVDSKNAEAISVNFRQCIEKKAQVQYDEFANIPNRSYSTSLFPIMEKNGAITRLIGISRDITQLKQTEAHLRDSETRFRLLFETMVQGVIVQSASGEIISANPAAERILGLTLEQMQGHTSIDPHWRAIREDGSEFPGSEYPAMVALATGQEIRNIVMGVFNPQAKDYFWFNIHAVPQYKDGEKKPYQVYTTFDDITDRKKIAETLKASETRYRLLAENISDVIWIYDIAENRTRYISPSVERLRGYTPEEVIAGTMENALTPASFQHVQKAIAMRLKDFQNGHREFYIDELEQTCKDGSTVWTEVTANFQVNSENGHTEIYGVSRNITERKLNESLLMQANKQLHSHVAKIEQLRAELHELAIRDPLTGLYNRRYLNDSLEREFSRAQRESLPVSLLMMDIDHFKIINDSHGHQLGDKFLIAIADLLKKNSRSSDIACRYGGEEFILVLPGTDTQAAYARAEHFRTKFAQIRISHDMKDLSITVSMGVASYPVHSTTAEDLINKADLALYQSKHNGRNRVTIWGEATEKSGG